MTVTELMNWYARLPEDQQKRFHKCYMAHRKMSRDMDKALRAAGAVRVRAPKKVRTKPIRHMEGDPRCTCGGYPPDCDGMFWTQDEEAACERRAARKS